MRQAAPGARPGVHLPEEDAIGVDVSGLADNAVDQGLWGLVGQGAVVACCDLGHVQAAAQTEVSHLGHKAAVAHCGSCSSRAEHDVPARQVAVHHVIGVQVAQGRGNLQRGGSDSLHTGGALQARALVQQPAAINGVLQAALVGVLHDHPGLIPGGALVLEVRRGLEHVARGGVALAGLVRGAGKAATYFLHVGALVVNDGPALGIVVCGRMVMRLENTVLRNGRAHVCDAGSLLLVGLDVLLGAHAVTHILEHRAAHDAAAELAHGALERADNGGVPQLQAQHRLQGCAASSLDVLHVGLHNLDSHRGAKPSAVVHAAKGSLAQKVSHLQALQLIGGGAVGGGEVAGGEARGDGGGDAAARVAGVGQVHRHEVVLLAVVALVRHRQEGGNADGHGAVVQGLLGGRPEAQREDFDGGGVEQARLAHIPGAVLGHRAQEELGGQGGAIHRLEHLAQALVQHLVTLHTCELSEGGVGVHDLPACLRARVNQRHAVLKRVHGALQAAVRSLELLVVHGLSLEHDVLLQLAHHQLRQVVHDHAASRIKAAWLDICKAQRAQPVAVAGDEWSTAVEAHTRRHRHLDVMGKPLVLMGIWNDQDLGVLEGQGPAAQGPTPGECAPGDHRSVLLSDVHALLIKKRTQRGRRLEDAAGQL
mmetsp:Transcript_35206/g.78354  ORF Transcript_35206/g.78354 Transcript_35206/m.78354 type:complete len:651 (+) Transcript_35206:594-2546(+)